MDSNKEPVDLENRLYGIYRFSIYGFGLIMAIGILGGSWFGLRMVQNHDSKHQISQKINQNLEHRAKAIPIQPFQKALNVQFSLPYQHGADAQTLSLIAKLADKKTASIPGGFTIPGEYKTNHIHQSVEAKLSCQNTLCQLVFEIPARLVLQPRLEGSKLVYPKRNFALQIEDTVFTVQNSRLVSLSLAQAEKQAPFLEPQNLSLYYKEIYLSSEGEKLTWKPQ